MGLCGCQKRKLSVMGWYMHLIFKIFLSLLFVFSTFVHGGGLVDLPFIKPEKVGMDAKKLELVDQKMEELIKEDRLAGGIVVIARKGKVAHFGTYGKRDLENNLPVEKDTIFRIFSRFTILLF